MSPEEQKLAEEWRSRYAAGFFDSEGNLKLEFVQRGSIEPLAKAMANASPKLTRHQVRRFFQHCRWLERQLQGRGAVERTWEQLRPDFNKLDVAASDAFAKRSESETKGKIPELFHEFIKHGAAAVRSERDFREGFLRHFEALIGFGQQYFDDKEKS